MKLLFCGDICFNYKLDVDAAMSADILADVKGVFDAADVRIMNLETPIFDEGVGTRIKKSGPNLTGRPHNLGFLTEAGCDCAILANNHTGDFGDEALYQTFDFLDRAGIPYCGAGHNIEEAYRAWRYAKDGITFSVTVKRVCVVVSFVPTMMTFSTGSWITVSVIDASSATPSS